MNIVWQVLYQASHRTRLRFNFASIIQLKVITKNLTLLPKIFELTKISLAREAAVYNNLAPMESLCTHCKLASGAMSNGGENAN